jgi:hypothetical protein
LVGGHHCRQTAVEDVGVVEYEEESDDDELREEEEEMAGTSRSGVQFY